MTNETLSIILIIVTYTLVMTIALTWQNSRFLKRDIDYNTKRLEKKIDRDLEYLESRMSGKIEWNEKSINTIKDRLNKKDG